MSVAVHLDEAEKQILGALLADFSDRTLTADQLTDGYEGPQVSDLTAAICAGGDVTQVDFDIAFSDLEKKKLINTGPYAIYENDPNSSVMFFGGYSKREYAGLTQLGYKTARQSPNRPSRVPRIVNNVNISGGHFSNVQLAAGSSVTQKMESTSGVDSEILTTLVSILEKQGQVVSINQRKDLAAVLEEASVGNGKQAKSMLEKVCGPAWESVQPVMWPIVGELVKKSLGL